jgi:AraC family transcriptional regulator
MAIQRLSYDTGCRASTIAARVWAVEQVIRAMRERLHEPLSLQDMANIAFVSPYHFNRIFRAITGIPPCEFLAMLRLDAARRLLLTTDRSVTDICFDVGYTSLGTFTTRFTQLVGLSPRRLRYLANGAAMFYLQRLCDSLTRFTHVVPLRTGLGGQVSVSGDFAGLIFIGLFSTPVPQGRPVACALLTRPGTYRMAPVPDGCYYLFAAGLSASDDPLAYLLSDMPLRGAGQGPLPVYSGQVSGSTDIMLRPVRLTDPPILIALPFLVAERLAAGTRMERPGGKVMAGNILSVVHDRETLSYVL